MSDAVEKQKDGPAALRMDVKRELLEWAIKRSGKTPEDVNKSNKNLKDWLGGKKKPTLRQLEKFATTTYAPFGYLLLPNPPEEILPIPHFRTLEGHTSTPSSDLIETIQIISQRQDWMRDRLIADGSDPLEFVGSAKLSDSPTKTAHDIKEKLGMTREWRYDMDGWEGVLAGMRDAMENVGIYVTTNGVVGNNNRRLLKVKEFRGFVLVDDYAPFVFVNGADSKAAQMFTLAHELAHVWIGRDAIFDLYGLGPANNQTEHICNQIAAEFLVPEEELAQSWNRTADVPKTIRALSRRFKVSKIVVARRALDLGFIDKETFYDFYSMLSDMTAKPNRGGNFYANANFRIGKRFAKAVVSAAKEEKILYRDAYRLIGLDRVTFEKFAERLGQE